MMKEEAAEEDGLELWKNSLELPTIQGTLFATPTRTSFVGDSYSGLQMLSGVWRRFAAKED